MLQKISELEEWHTVDDPWNYESNEDDIKRKEILLKHLKDGTYNNVLDIGCGQGFITRDLPGKYVVGVDISSEAIKKAKQYENQRIHFQEGSIFELEALFSTKFDLIIITGVLYPQYIGNSHNLIYMIIDNLLEKNGLLISVHIEEWCQAKFPYLRYEEIDYKYRKYVHKMECYIK